MFCSRLFETHPTKAKKLGGLKPGLVQKWQNATTAEGKWAFLKAFLLDPQSLSSITVEAEYVDMAIQDNDSKWKEVPLSTLRKEYTSPEEKRFLHKVITEQAGRPHPQSPEDQEMRLFWIFKENTDVSRSRKSIGHRIRAQGQIPDNKAASEALENGLTTFASGFGGKGGKDWPSYTPEPSKGKGKGKNKGKPREKKVGVEFPFHSRFYPVPTWQTSCSAYIVVIHAPQKSSAHRRKHPRRSKGMSSTKG